MTIVKVCKKHGELTLDQVWKEPGKLEGKPYYRCKICRQVKRIGKAYDCKIHGKLTVDDVYEHGQCKQCKRDYAKEYKKNNKEMIMDKIHKDRMDNPEKWDEIYKKAYIKRKDRYGSLLSLLKVCESRGITLDDYQRMLEKQNNKCAICNEQETRKNPHSDGVLRLCIDHCHKTGKVRGLLCHSCNTALGKFKDSAILMYRAIRYLKTVGA